MRQSLSLFLLTFLNRSDADRNEKHLSDTGFLQHSGAGLDRASGRIDVIDQDHQVRDPVLILRFAFRYSKGMTEIFQAFLRPQVFLRCRLSGADQKLLVNGKSGQAPQTHCQFPGLIKATAS